MSDFFSEIVFEKPTPLLRCMQIGVQTRNLALESFRHWGFPRRCGFVQWASGYRGFRGTGRI